MKINLRELGKAIWLEARYQSFVEYAKEMKLDEPSKEWFMSKVWLSPIDPYSETGLGYKTSIRAPWMNYPPRSVNEWLGDIDQSLLSCRWLK